MGFASAEYERSVPVASSSPVLHFPHIARLAYAHPMELDGQFGVRLRKAREEKHLSQEGLGKGLGERGEDVSKQTVYGWEKGRHFPTARQLALICDTVSKSADYLLFGISSADGVSVDALRLAQTYDKLGATQKAALMAVCSSFMDGSPGKFAPSQQDEPQKQVA